MDSIDVIHMMLPIMILVVCNQVAFRSILSYSEGDQYHQSSNWAEDDGGRIFTTTRSSRKRPWGYESTTLSSQQQETNGSWCTSTKTESYSWLLGFDQRNKNLHVLHDHPSILGNQHSRHVARWH